MAGSSKGNPGFKVPQGFGLINDGFKKDKGMTTKKDGLLYVDPEDQESFCDNIVNYGFQIRDSALSNYETVFCYMKLSNLII